ncbi:hypothetical protein MN116_008590 [Schistosoma mekongi]|uniref:ATP synthase F1 subunit epsilon n=1 Tax=Schistosoma mekongi TaxID=38744 RepID=A0AAE2D1G1_SCHME|nr:hypothetical protein MN116_008590 [Schistosoma mekongi]
MQRLLTFIPQHLKVLLKDPMTFLKPMSIGCIRMYPGDEFGRGAGKGGGGGGSIRDAGGAFGKLEARNEEEYFYKLQQQQLRELKKHLEDEHEREVKEIKRLEESLKRRKKLLEDLEKKR